MTNAHNMYLCPERRISFDGFVNYEDRRFGVPYWYTNRVCRVQRLGDKIRIWADDLSRVLTTHDVTWSKKDSFCEDQYVNDQPEEKYKLGVRNIHSGPFQTGKQKPVPPPSKSGKKPVLLTPFKEKTQGVNPEYNKRE